MGMEQELGRIADALNRIADRMGEAPVVTSRKPAPTPAADPVTPSTEGVDREFLKKELTRFKIPFSPKAKTETLHELYLKTVESQGEQPGYPDPEPAVPQATDTIAVEVVRERLKKFASLQGPDAAVRLLKEFGVEKVSDLKDEQRPQFIAKLDELEGVKK